METINIRKTSCATCGKNLDVIRKRNVVRIDDEAYCSKACIELSGRPQENRKLSRFFGGTKVKVAAARH